MEFKDILKGLRKKAGLTQKELAEKSGISYSYITKLENGFQTNPTYEILEALGEVLKAPVGAMYDFSDVVDIEHKIKGVQIPVLGYVRAGIPIDAVEDILDYEEITPAMAATGDYFGLRVKGDSMEPKISEGDVVIVREQPDVESGEIAIVLINGDDATVKRLVKYDNGSIALVALNPAYHPIIFTPEQIDELPVRVIGKVVELRAKF